MSSIVEAKSTDGFFFSQATMAQTLHIAFAIASHLVECGYTYIRNCKLLLVPIVQKRLQI
jgi:hypothetical protein